MSSLPELIHHLESRRRSVELPYHLPGLWVGNVNPEAVQVDPYDFYLKCLTDIAATDAQTLAHGSGRGEWSRNAVVYNLLPRLTAAFDHDGDGQINIGPNNDGWRETGTLLKCIALLPYIRSMGFNTVHLLPITAVGQDGKKGTLGSPYAVRNPYQLDETLDEPALDISVDQLFAAFVDAAHLLGMRVILEFVLRTGARDSDWIPQHPDWFYWIKADIPDRVRGATDRVNSFGSPVFSSDTLDHIKAKVNAGNFNELPPPSLAYRTMFTRAPRPDQIFMDSGRYFGTLDDGTRVRIPGAFTDWPPDDNQPPWTDVTYLRMFKHPIFNYMAYNTLRMYDSVLAREENRNELLWDAITGVIPHFQRTFGIDGVMIDMGHALPADLKQRVIMTAREINPDFAFWDENFAISQASRQQGYNAVMGWWVLAAHEPDGIRNVIHQMAHGSSPISFFAAPENHNTVRAAARTGGLSYSHYVLALAVTLPAIPFILSGFELGETQPVNTGLGFSADQLAYYSAERLGLFSACAYDWCRSNNIVKSVRYALNIRKKYEGVLNDTHPESFVLGYSDNPRILVFSRRSNGQWITVIANTDQFYEQRGRVVLNARSFRVPGLWGTSEVGMDLYDEMMANVSLVPGYVLILDSSELPH